MAILEEIGASIRQLAQGAGTSVVGVGQRWGAGWVSCSAKARS